MPYAHQRDHPVSIQPLNETPFYAELQGRDGLPCRVWKNPVTEV